MLGEIMKRSALLAGMKNGPETEYQTDERIRTQQGLPSRSPQAYASLGRTSAAPESGAMLPASPEAGGGTMAPDPPMGRMAADADPLSRTMAPDRPMGTMVPDKRDPVMMPIQPGPPGAGQMAGFQPGQGFAPDAKLGEFVGLQDFGGKHARYSPFNPNPDPAARKALQTYRTGTQSGPASDPSAPLESSEIGSLMRLANARGQELQGGELPADASDVDRYLSSHAPAFRPGDLAMADAPGFDIAKQFNARKNPFQELMVLQQLRGQRRPSGR